MKSFWIITIMYIATYSAKASSESILPIEPEAIVSITQELHELDYYHTQVKLWSAETKKNDKNANAWMNYYLASRVVNILTSDADPHDLDRLFLQLEKNVPDTYEYHYLTYLNGKGDTSLFFHLEKAFALDPKRTEVLSHFVAYYAINGDLDNMSLYNKLWLESGEISAGILNWNYNAMIALDENAILLTYGDNDTYPSWMLQQVHDIRADVEVININLLRSREYIDNVFDRCGIKRYSPKTGEQTVWENDFLPVIEHIFQDSGRPIYVNVTVPKKLRDNYKNVLYTVGLAFKYSEASFDNIGVLKNNYENKFLIDYLKIGFSTDKSATVLNLSLIHI